MVKITIIALGRDKDNWVTEACQHYTKLISRYARLEWKLIKGPKTSDSISPEEIKALEAKAIRKAISGGRVIALSDSGAAYDSHKFAKFLEHQQSHGGSQLNFLIGGPYGLDSELIDKADKVISLSPLTFSHQLVRLVLAEQLYRGFSILHGTDYHK